MNPPAASPCVRKISEPSHWFASTTLMRGYTSYRSCRLSGFSPFFPGMSDFPQRSHGSFILWHPGQIIGALLQNGHLLSPSFTLTRRHIPAEPTFSSQYSFRFFALL